MYGSFFPHSVFFCDGRERCNVKKSTPFESRDKFVGWIAPAKKALSVVERIVELEKKVVDRVCVWYIYIDSREERCAVTAYKSFWAFETNLAEVHNASKMATGMEKNLKRLVGHGVKPQIANEIHRSGRKELRESGNIMN